MKIPYFLLLTACVTNVYAGPPVLDSSTNSNSVPPANVPAQTIPSYDQVTNLNKVQSDVNDLKNKVQEQSNAIDYLQRVNADLQKRVADLGGGKVANAAPAFIASVPAGALADEKTRYNNASNALKVGDYTQAQQGFQSVITTYPNGDYADNSQYWIGVALLNKGDKTGAVRAFDLVARNYPKSDKIPDAMFKMGDTLLVLNNKPKAKEYFDYVIQNYPNTNGANLAAKKKIAARL
jgi:tol-pal system protein YbgF